MVNEQPNVRPKWRYSISEAARILGVSPTTLYRYIKSGIMKNIIRPNGQTVVTGSEITRFWAGEYV